VIPVVKANKDNGFLAMKPIGGKVNSTGGNALVLARRYWPYSSDATHRVRNLVRNLRQENWNVQLLTPRWHNNWPGKVNVEECIVHRLDHAPSNQLRQSLYRRSLSQWLDEFGQWPDWVYCDEASLDALTVSNHPLVNKRQVPVIVRFDPTELAAATADLNWQIGQSHIDACTACSAVVVSNQVAQHQLLRFGIPAQRLVSSFDWSIRSLDRSPHAIRQARQALADVNYDLSLRTLERVILVPGSLNCHWQLDMFIEAVAPLLDTHPALRVWIHGEGPLQEQLLERLQFLGHHRTVALPGMFSCLDTLLQAADLCVFPAANLGLGWLIPTCLISGIPVLAAGSSAFDSQLGHLASSFSFEAGSQSNLRDRLEQWAMTPEPLIAAARAAGQMIRQKAVMPSGGIAASFGMHPTARTATFTAPRPRPTQ
jgi:glycosyltransferase involved in cell wall biosynthesis